MTVLSRRALVTSSLVATAVAACPHGSSAAPVPLASLKGELGITTGSFMQHLRQDRQRHKTLLLELPQRMREELGMRVIDLMTATLPSWDDAYLDQLRSRAEKYGCVITNLKMNQDVNMASADEAQRRHALDVYKTSIEAAARLGCRWVRPAPRNERPDLDRLVAGYRELIDTAGPRGITLLVENNGWMKDDPDAIPALIERVGPGLAACPDTGNWTNRARFAGLAKAYPLAVSCDFKAFEFTPEGEHAPYDLQRCFQVGFDAGYRGPWCFEHFNVTLDGLWRGFARLRDLLKGWMSP